MKPRGVIFDFDGVVVDSLGLHLDAWSEACQRLFRRPLHEPRRFKGYSTTTIAHMIAQEHGHGSQAQALATTKRQIMAEKDKTPTLLPGVRELMQALQERQLPFGIASNAPRQFIVSSVEKLKLPVSIIVALDDVRRGKPFPDPYNLCATLLGMSPEIKAQSLVLEDSFHGLQAAITAGMIPIGVASHHSHTELKQAGAILVCDSPQDVLNQGWLDDLPMSASA